MKLYHWLIITIITLLWFACSNPKMQINGVDVNVSYEILKHELISQGCELYNEDAPVIPIDSYKFILKRSPQAIMLTSIASLSLADYNNVIAHYSREYVVNPIIEGRESFFNLYNREPHRMSEFNIKEEAFKRIINIATDYAEGALLEIDKDNYIFIGYTSNWHSSRVHVLYYVLE